MTAQLPPQKQMTGMLGHPVAENPIDRMFDAVYAHYGLHWQFWKCDVAADDLGAAIAGTRALGFRGYGITVPYKIAAIPFLDAIDEDARVIGAANWVTNENGRLIGHNNDGKGVVKAINIRATRITTNDNIDILVPNSVFLEQSIVNRSKSSRICRASVSVGDSTADSDEAKLNANLLLGFGDDDFGGLVVVEKLFNYPGIGRLMAQAATLHDVKVLEATVLVVAAIYMLSNLTADVVVAALSPRVRLGG